LTQAFAPGTIVNLAAGTYSHSGRFYLQLAGTSTNPIQIIGPASGAAIFLQTNPSGANAMEVGKTQSTIYSWTQLTFVDPFVNKTAQTLY